MSQETETVTIQSSQGEPITWMQVITLVLVLVLCSMVTLLYLIGEDLRHIHEIILSMRADLAVSPPYK